jgi:5-(carboxyamino)imidazole ribonucleotide synthase
MNEQETIGIVGGGQLGRMLTLAALPLGFKVVVINPSSGSPASQVGAEEIVADLYDTAALKSLADLSDHMTIEIEHLDAGTLDTLATQGSQVNPAPKTIKLIQDKFLQKQFLKSAGIPVASFVEIIDEKSARKALKDFGGKMLLKTRHGAYDGRGNMLISKTADIDKAFKLFKDRQLYAEAYIPFKKELAVMVARNTSGDVAAYPIVETIHERNICVEVLAPAPIQEQTRKKAERIALKVARLLEGAGTFGIEMFLTEKDEVLVNEIAPRVHNSGHYTMEANRTSQFEQHIRAVTGLPLGDTSMIVPAAVMINVLGDRDGPTVAEGLNDALMIPGVSVHLYGKSPTKVDRKMGHITATGVTIEEARERARRARQHLSI